MYSFIFYKILIKWTFITGPNNPITEWMLFILNLQSYCQIFVSNFSWDQKLHFIKILKHHKAGFHDHPFRRFYTMSIEKYLSKQQGGVL